MSSSTEPKPKRAGLTFALALAGFILCDGAALLALGNLVGLWHLSTSWLLALLGTGVVCLAVGLLARRVRQC